MDIAEEDLIENDARMDGIILPESHFRFKRRVIDENYIECETDQTVFLAELFAIDRTTLRTPVKLWEQGSEKFYYSKYIIPIEIQQFIDHILYTEIRKKIQLLNQSYYKSHYTNRKFIESKYNDST